MCMLSVVVKTVAAMVVAAAVSTEAEMVVAASTAVSESDSTKALAAAPEMGFMLTVVAPGAAFMLIVATVITVGAIMAVVIAADITVAVIITVMVASGLGWVGDILILAFTLARFLSDAILSIG